jgi:deoxyinosine 3'endonuclease (endonuclease V)
VIHVETQPVRLGYPYIPGYLAFREYAALGKVFADLIQRKPEWKPQVLLVDGNGQLHPRGGGIASHFGLFSKIPTIGCAKSFFPVDGLNKAYIQTAVALKLHARRREDDWTMAPHEFLIGESGRRHGAAVLTGGKGAKNPIFVSVGHRVSLETALKIVKACAIRRVPEPIRIADSISREHARQHHR